MRAVDPLLQARLDSGATTLCRCWRVTRADGTVMGFTDHDRDLSFEGTVFAAASGLTAAALEQSNGLSVDNGAVSGALSSAGIREEDLAMGRYDEARISQWIVDWTDPALRLQVFEGRFGEITRNGALFEVELRGLSEALSATVGHSYLRECGARLGDARCGVALSDPAFSATATVTGLPGEGRLAVSGLEAHARGWFALGRLTWNSGANAGLSVSLRDDQLVDGVRTLVLHEDPPAPVAPGDEAAVIAGCDKTAETCRAKFANFLNFRGFPHLPGEDWATGYVTEGQSHDGGSLFS